MPMFTMFRMGRPLWPVHLPERTRSANSAMRSADPAVDVATLAAAIVEPDEHHDPSVVKAVISLRPGGRVGRALWFSRLPAPGGAGPLYHHIGLYAYRRAALERFVNLPPAPIEQREKLEQLRALEAGMRIDAALVDSVPLGVDTAADLARIRALLNH